MTRVRLLLAFAPLSLAMALGGCATTGRGGAELTEATAIEGTRVVSAEHVRAPAAGAVPLRSPARVMRIWIAPWEDSRGDLHAPGYLYTEIDPRHWALDDRDDAAPPVRPLQIERRDAPSRTSRPQRDTGATRTPARPAARKSGPNRLDS
jgi:hypothetical protein